jgi:hypothetical protein
MLMKVEHVLDIRQSNRLTGRECKAHKSSQAVEGCEAVRHRAAQREQRASDRRPEKHWRTTPEVDPRDPEDSADAAVTMTMLLGIASLGLSAFLEGLWDWERAADLQHDHIEVTGVVDFVWTHVPFCASVVHQQMHMSVVCEPQMRGIVGTDLRS